MFLNDQETATDLLYYDAIAKTVVRLIREAKSSPITIGVHGDWGAGKSSILKMTEKAFEGDEKSLCLWFNGWTFEGFEDAKTIAIETIIDELKRARPNSVRVKDAAGKLLQRVDWLKVAHKVGGYAFTAVTGVPTFDQIQGFFNTATALLAKPQDHVSIEDIKDIASKAGDFIRDRPEKADRLPEHIHAFRGEFEKLLEAAEIDRLVVIVDDLDRCLPKTAIATLEAIRLFLFVDRTAFVIGADEAMIEYAVKEHFPDLPPSSGPVSYSRNYLEKLIQIPFRIPALGLSETRVYVTLLLAESALGSSDLSFKALLNAAREDMRRPWMSRGLDRNAIAKAIGVSPIPPEIDQALVLSTQVTKILSEGTRGNPRQIKRFLNSLLLRNAIAEERGFGSDVKLPVLAKIMLAESFYPNFYEQIARLAASDANGAPKLLIQFEEEVSGSGRSDEKPEASGKGMRKSAVMKPPESSADFEEWTKNDWIKGWAALAPSLKNVDLRPYVFVTRDKRSSLGGLVVTSHLEHIVEKLFGPKLMVRAAADEVAKLTGPEPEEVFEAIRTRILQEDSFAKAPAGVDGLVLLLEKHPTLQRKLLAFIRDLPTQKLGTWATSKWGTCFQDPTSKSELKQIVTEWSNQSENTNLKNAAQQSLKLTGG